MLEHMKQVHNSIAPVVEVAPTILSPLMEQQQPLSLDGVVEEEGEDAWGTTHTSSRRELKRNADVDTSMMDPRAEAYMRALLKPMYFITSDESFIDDLGNIIRRGLAVSKDSAKTTTKGLATLDSKTPGSDSNPESAKFGDTLAKRAIMGELLFKLL